MMSANAVKTNPSIPLRTQPSGQSAQGFGQQQLKDSQIRTTTISRKQQPAPTSMKPTPQLEAKSKKVPNGRRSSKPIINWFQKKLAGTVKARRSENGAPASAEKDRGLVPPRGSQRIAPSPFPPSATVGRQQGKQLEVATKRKTISLNGDDDGRDYFPHTDDEDLSLDRSSTWSPNSAPLEADEDASVRPIPPSSPPSPSPSRSSSSYLSDPRTFRSIAASTKPTTLLSIDLNGGGMAHIAQVPPGAPSPVTRFPHIRTSSQATGPPMLAAGTSVTFSALQPSGSSSRPASLQIPASITQQSSVASATFVHAPLHTAHHPRNNPRPSSPPLDNASMLTLASSAYAIPGQRPGIGTSAPPSAVLGGGDSLSHFGGGGSMGFPDAESTSQFIMGDDERLEERDFDASVRALRPRSSRRGSWESEVSRWSARVQPGPGTPSLARERSVWTTNSVRTGPLNGENVDQEDDSDLHIEKGDRAEANSTELSDAEPEGAPSTLATPAHAADSTPSLDSSPTTSESAPAGPIVADEPTLELPPAEKVSGDIINRGHDLSKEAHIT